MKKIVERTYRCEVCGGLYPHASGAAACEKRPVEKRVFRKGDVVAPVGWEPRVCCTSCGYLGPRKKIKKVTVVDVFVEREYKWLGLSNAEKSSPHKWCYEVAWHCLNDGRVLTARCPASELQLIRKHPKNKKFKGITNEGLPWEREMARDCLKVIRKAGKAGKGIDKLLIG